MRKAAPGCGSGAAKVVGDKNKLHRLHTFLPLQIQAHPQATLDRLALFRVALDHWRTSGAECPMPQPRDHGVRLPDLDPSQVLWGAP